MAHGETRNADGVESGGDPWYKADAARTQTYIDANRVLAQFAELVHRRKLNEYLFIAAFDGTGSDLFKDAGNATSIGKIFAQTRDAVSSGMTQVHAGYVAGPGTQDEFLRRTVDGMNGNTYDERLEDMYKQFIDQAGKWKHENPNARISIADIGFSRGGDMAAGFARLVHERGIQDPSGAVYTRNSHGEITHAEYTKPPLVAPGQVAQVVGLLDPVGTGEPIRDHDRRLPPSVISGFQIIAADERRGLFKSDHLIDPGMTADGRFLAVTVAGAHSDIGGGDHPDGLAIRNVNMLARYLNATSDQPLIKEQPEPTDPRLNVVHRSEEGRLLYRIWPKVDRGAPGGYNELLVPRRLMAQVADPFNAEPRDEGLNARFERRLVGSAAQTRTDEPQRELPTSELSARLDRLVHFGQTSDWASFGRENQALAFGDAGRMMLEQAAITVLRQEQHAAQRTELHQGFQQQPARQQATQHAVQVPVMQH